MPFKEHEETPTLANGEPRFVWIDPQWPLHLDRMDNQPMTERLKVARPCPGDVSADFVPDCARAARDDVACDETADNDAEW
jgi:hypothetical protein